MGGDDDAEVMNSGYVETARFYADTFGENYAATDAAMVSVMFNVPIEKVMDGQALGEFIVLIIGYGIWWWYVSVSVRVKNTFVN